MDKWLHFDDHAPPSDLSPFHPQSHGALLETELIKRNAKVLGEAMCGYSDALADAVVKECSGNSESARCASVRHSYNHADGCAGTKYDDTVKCQKACGWTQKWRWNVLSIVTSHEERDVVPVSQGFKPIFSKVDDLRTYIKWWCGIRFFIYAGIWVYTSCYWCFDTSKAENLREEQDDEEDEDRYENSEDEHSLLSP